MKSFLKGFPCAPFFPLVYAEFASGHGADALLNYRSFLFVSLTVRIINKHQSNNQLPNDNPGDFHKHSVGVNKKYM
jgi:hypothetical protein